MLRLGILARHPKPRLLQTVSNNPGDGNLSDRDRLRSDPALVAALPEVTTSAAQDDDDAMARSLLAQLHDAAVCACSLGALQTLEPHPATKLADATLALAHNYGPPTAGRLLLAAWYWPPTASLVLLTGCLLSTADRLPPTTDGLKLPAAQH